MHKAYLLLGSNMGNRTQHLANAISFLNTIGYIKKTSSIYETAAWGKRDQAAFLNQAVLLNTILSPYNLLKNILEIEEKLGRKRVEQYGSRIIDIDILFFDEVIIHTENLVIPHAALTNRKFTLEPLAEIAPDIIHPIYQKTIKILLKECADELKVEKLTELKSL